MTPDSSGRGLDIDGVMRLCPVIPVLVIEDPADGRPIAQALVRGGLRVLEVTLRTDAALDVIREMSTVGGAVVGAGTILSAADVERSFEAGARFVVSPGLNRSVAETAAAARVPLLPGIANASDIMLGLELGLSRFKFFPAEAAGGIPALRALAAPFRDVRFCPTGGITEDTARAWLNEPSVLCVGGSWLVSGGVADLGKITAAARRAVEQKNAG